MTRKEANSWATFTSISSHELGSIIMLVITTFDPYVALWTDAVKLLLISQRGSFEKTENVVI